MTPEQINLFLTSLALIVERIGTWPLWTTLLMIVIGPWILAMLLSYWQMRRFEAVVRMYECNVDLVKSYEGLARDLKDVVMMNTEAMTRLGDRLAGRLRA